MNPAQNPSSELAPSSLGAPTPMSSASSSQHSLPRGGTMFHQNFTGVDKLILAANRIESFRYAMFKQCNNAIAPPSAYTPYNLSYYQMDHQVNQFLRLGGNFTNQYTATQPTPKNKHELELYELLRQANLLDYFGKFIKFGGDDVQQLADADEAEFLEIMELVEMNHKPLHMRRMQKVLNNWRQERGDTIDPSDTDFRRPNSLSDSVIFVHKQDAQSIGPTPTSASRSLFPVDIDKSPQQYSTPHEVIKNAPKKPRLMDSIRPLDFDGPLRSTPKRDRPHKQLDSDRPRSLTGYSPPESPASIASIDSDLSEPVIEVGSPENKDVAVNKRKRGLRKPSAANLRKYYGLSTNPVDSAAASRKESSGK